MSNVRYVLESLEALDDSVPLSRRRLIRRLDLNLQPISGLLLPQCASQRHV